MKRFVSENPNVVITIILIVVLLVLGALSARGDVQVLPSYSRLAPTATAGSDWAGPVLCAQGETQSFQAGVFAPAGSYTVTWSAPAGITVKAYEAYWTRAAAKTPYWFPDGLLAVGNGGAITITDKPGAVWFDVRGEQAGSYQITITIGATTKLVPVTVWPFSLPSSPALKSAIGLFPTRGQLGAELLLLEHRLMATFIDSAHASALNGAGQTQAHAGGYASMSGTSVSTAPPTAAQIDAWVEAYKPLAPYSYLQDEEYDATSLANLCTYANNMQGKVKRMMTTTITPASAWLDITTVLAKFADPSLVAERIAAGKEVWLYQTLSQDTYTPKWLLHYSYPNWSLMAGFAPWRYGMTGLLYWRADYEKAGYDPWSNADAYGSSYPGEASWLLPILNGAPSATFTGATDYAPTIRLKWLRDGVDTYDYLTLLEAAGERAYADSVTATVFPSWTEWSKDAAAVYNARVLLGERLAALAVPPAVPEPATGGGSTVIVVEPEPEPHVITVSAAAIPSRVKSLGQVSCAATASCSLGHTVSSFAWSDGGAGGSFDNATARTCTYTAPRNRTGKDLTVTLTVTATCDGVIAQAAQMIKVARK